MPGKATSASPTSASAIPGAIRAGALYRLTTFKRIMSWGHKPFWQAKRQGLRTITFGRQTFIRGDDVLDFFAKLAEKQAAAEAREREQSLT